MSLKSTVSTDTFSSKQSEPSARFVVSHHFSLNALPDTPIPLQICVGQASVTVVPDFRRQLVSPNKIFERLFVSCAVHKQPPGFWITHPIAERDVQSEGHFVNEVIHITLQASVVMACEKQPPPVVYECPARAMNGQHPCQTPPVENMPG